MKMDLNGKMILDPTRYIKWGFVGVGIFEPCVQVLAHCDQVDTSIPMAGATTFGRFQLVIDFLSFDTTLNTSAQAVSFLPFVAGTANGSEQPRLIIGVGVECATVSRSRTWRGTFPFS